MQRLMLSDSPIQVANVTITDGENAKIEFRFMPFAQSWTYSVEWEDVVINGQRLVLSSDVLAKWKNILDFSLVCVSMDGLDPINIDDFSSGRVTVYVASREEIDELH